MADYPKLRSNLTIKTDDDLGFTSSCLSCQSFIEAQELCKVYNARPPARVIAFGCDRYVDNDGIPF